MFQTTCANCHRLFGSGGTIAPDLTGSGRHNAVMASGCGLSHQCPGEPSLGERETAAGVTWTSAGENIGEGGPVPNRTAAIAQMAVALTQGMLDEQPPGLPAALSAAGLRPEDIDLVVLSHLHFDHCGALVAPGQDGELAALFPRAKHVVQGRELEAWRHPDPRSRPSYKPENLGLLERAGRLLVVDGDQQVAPGIQVRVTGGHTAGHQAVYVRDQEQTVVFTGDFLLVRALLKSNWVSALDLFPLDDPSGPPAAGRQ